MLFAAVIIAFAVSFAGTLLVRRVALRCGAISYPDGHRRRHELPTPLWGGAAVFAGMCVALALPLFGASSTNASLLRAFLVSGALLCLLGTFDDRFELRARWKLLGQVIAVAPVFWIFGHVEELDIGTVQIYLGPMGVPFTLLWILAGTNAFNLLDGMDGFAAVTATAVALAVAFLAAWGGQAEELALALVLAGALLGFLPHNLPRARIYLGDCGSLVIGLALALAALAVTGRSTRYIQMNPPTAFCLFFLPLADTTLAVIRRTLRGRGFMTADREHVHHRLLDRGFSPWTILALAFAMSSAVGSVACISAILGREFWIWILAPIWIALLIRMRLVAHVEWDMVLARLRGPRTVFPETYPHAPPHPHAIDRETIPAPASRTAA